MINECKHNWEALQIPKEKGKGIAYWKCIKCNFIKHQEVEII